MYESAIKIQFGLAMTRAIFHREFTVRLPKLSLLEKILEDSGFFLLSNKLITLRNTNNRSKQNLKPKKVRGDTKLRKLCHFLTG